MSRGMSDNGRRISEICRRVGGTELVGDGSGTVLNRNNYYLHECHVECSRMRQPIVDINSTNQGCYGVTPQGFGAFPDEDEDEDPTVNGHKEAIGVSLPMRKKKKQKPTFNMCSRVWNLHEIWGTLRFSTFLSRLQMEMLAMRK